MAPSFVSAALLSLLALAGSGSAQQCKLTFDGRLPNTATPTFFDQPTSPYLYQFVFGQNTSFGELIKIPSPPLQDQFDILDKTKAFEVTISDKSIFVPSPGNAQTGFRRAELIPNLDNNSTTGIKTFHWSLRSDTSRPLNYTHEYQLVFLESSDYSTNQFALKTGRVAEIVAKDPNMDPKFLYFQGNVRDFDNIKTLFKVPFLDNVWHNFAAELNFNKNTTQVYYSLSELPLIPVTGAVSNDVSGNGQYHFGVLKKPTGDNLTDVTKQGFQESHINEGIIYGGIFEEDSSKGCVSKTGL